MKCNYIPTPCEKTNTFCVIRDKDMPQNSKLEGCEVRLDLIIDELYSIIKEQDKRIKTLEESKVKETQQKPETILEACDLNIENCFKVDGLDPCGENIKTLGQALNYLKDGN